MEERRAPRSAAYAAGCGDGELVAAGVLGVPGVAADPVGADRVLVDQLIELDP
jgi:hypothetical protein